jgi:hypothetical protein
MSQLELGQATIVYEDPEDGQTEETVDNEQLVYVRDHWAVRSGTDERGNDLMKQIPRDRVYRVERNVQAFEEEAQTMKHRIESFADDIRRKIPVDVGDRRGTGRGTTAEAQEEPTRIAVKDSEASDERDGSTQ